MYTHSYELSIDGISLAGQMSFGVDGGFQLEDGVSMKYEQAEMLLLLCSRICEGTRACGEIQNMAINIKEIPEPEYTHDFELSVNGIAIDGEIGFNASGVVRMKTSTNVEITDRQGVRLLALVKQIARTCCECGEIEKLEITKII